MRRIALTMRVSTTEYGERRDSLDQQWLELFQACGFLPVLLPNQPTMALMMCEQLQVDGMVFTGGNSLMGCQGDAPERDATETALLQWALVQKKPVLGVCRGMQLIQQHFGVVLQPVSGHVSPQQTITIDGVAVEVNSYHHWGSLTSVPKLAVWAKADDGMVKAIRHPTLAVMGVMWHPERIHPFAQRDISMLKGYFER